MYCKKKLPRKLCSLLLTMMLLLAIVPTTAFAASTGFNTVLVGSSNITNEETWSSTKNGGTITWDAGTATLTLNDADLSQWSQYEGKTYGIAVVATDTTRTVTLKLIGTNTIGTAEQPCLGGSSVWINTNTVIEAEEGAKLNIYGSSADSDIGNAFYINGNLDVKGGTMDLTSGYPAMYTDNAITIEDGNIKANSTSSSAIFGYNGITIKGENTEITTESLYCSLICRGNDIIISDGAKVIGTTTEDSVVYNSAGNIVLSDATVTLNSDFSGSTGLFVDNTDGNIVIKNSNLTINTQSSAIFTKDKDVTVTDSVLNLTSAHGNSINSWGKLTIEGDKTNITANSATPLYGWDVLSITGGTISSTVTAGTAISSTRGISITGGTVSAKTSAAMSAIYSENGDITIDGEATTVNAESEQDTAIFARDGQVNLNSPKITAKAAEGFAAIVARQYSKTGTEETIFNKIIMESDNLTVKGGADLAVTEWAPTGNTSGDQMFYSDSVFVTKDTDSTIADLTNALQNVSVVYKDANYTAVNDVIKAANALKADQYQNFSAVTDAINAVEKGLDITQQDTVDGYATAIQAAIDALVYKEANYDKVNAAITKIPTDLSGYTDESVAALNAAKDAVVTGMNITQQGTVDGFATAIENAVKGLEKKVVDPTNPATPSNPSKPTDSNTPQTGDTSNMALWIGLLFISGGVMTALEISKKRKKANGQ